MVEAQKSGQYLKSRSGWRPPSSSSPPPSSMEGGAYLGGSGGDEKSNRKQGDQSLHKLMYLNCWILN